MLARQSFGSVTWKLRTPAGTSEYSPTTGTSTVGRKEFDPLGADIGLYAPPVPDTNGGQGEIGSNHFGGITSERWSNFFDLPSGCSGINGAAASCSGSMAQKNLDAEMRADFGYRWYDLPGNWNEAAQHELRHLYIIYTGFDTRKRRNRYPRV